ncbi:2-succinyl-6-hydroxy-2,4-cyclohexadiene-1-carboxylate synthase [Pseudaeromonas sp. ZJS20]|uniref:2-succinyl-6-hydroxy-2, 4-cyclohexadiene-1-carboxylate synthase n=1 Tax=Pseudaeromonas aegiceratis TaxID=3153928 RepID=UPI00390C70C7
MAELVLLHGLLGDRQDWQPLLACLPGVDALALDLPGHGREAARPLRRLADFPAWLNARLQAEGIRRYHLLGYSLGGRLALYHAAAGAPGLQSLILEGAHPGLVSQAERRERARQDALWARRFYRDPLATVLEDWYRQPVFAELSDAQRIQLIEARRQNDGRRLARTYCATSLARQPDLAPWLAGTRLPLAYLYGQQDGKFAAIATRLAAVQPKLNRQAVPDAGHNAHRGNPEFVARWLHHWLAGQPISSPTL